MSLLQLVARRHGGHGGGPPPPPEATKLSITTQPSSSVTGGVAFPRQPIIQLRDASNTPVAQAGVVVTCSVASGAAVLGGTLTAATDASGVATFSDLALTPI